jgi:hypothetical protein
MHDVLDVEAFVRDAIRAGNARLSLEEYEDLLGEGMLIMSRLAKSYQPGFGGRDPAGSSFAGYASKHLRLKLGDSYHRLQENHRLVAGEDGKRRWQYDPRPASLDVIVEETGTDHIRELRAEDVYDGDHAQRIGAALDRRWGHDRRMTVKFGVLLGLGYQAGDAQKALRIGAREAGLCVERLRDVALDLAEVAA